MYGVAVLEPIEQLRALLAEDRWDDAVRQIACFGNSSAHRSGADHPADDLDDPLMCGIATELPRCQNARQEFHLRRRAAPHRPALDPTLGLDLGRAASQRRPGGGLLAEIPQGARNASDLNARRGAARALVWRHLGEEHVEEAEGRLADAVDSPFGQRPNEREVKADAIGRSLML